MNENEPKNLTVTLKLNAEDNPWPTESNGISGWRLVRRSHAWRPPTDVLETDEAFVVEVPRPLAGAHAGYHEEQETRSDPYWGHHGELRGVCSAVGRV